MGFNRLDAKLQAKASMRSAYPHPMLVTLVYLLATTVLVGIIQFVISNPFNYLYTYLMQGYTFDEIYDYYFALMMGGRGVLFFFVSILVALYTTVMGFGYTSYALRLARNEQPGYRTLLDGFAMAGRVIAMLLWQFVFIFLWTMLAVVPFIALLVIGETLHVDALAVVGTMLYIAGLVWVVIVTYRYRLAAYFLLDDPACGARESITRSKLAMKGRKLDLFVLDLSFIGWEILSAFTLGILGIWLSPYRGATEANFYDWATGGLNGPQPPAADAGPEVTF